VSKLSAKVFF